MCPDRDIHTELGQHAGGAHVSDAEQGHSPKASASHQDLHTRCAAIIRVE